MIDVRQAIQAGDALGDDVLVGREHIVGQGFPVGKMQNRQGWREERQFFLEAFGALAVGGQQQGEAFGLAGRLGDGQGQRGPGQVAPVLFARRGGQGRKTQYRHGRLVLMTKRR
ncbi:hypothetical protein D3C77_571930 [compost metagenome]